jgi:hypothetical protein
VSPVVTTKLNDSLFIRRVADRIRDLFMTDLFLGEKLNQDLFDWVLFNEHSKEKIVDLVLNTDHEMLESNGWSLEVDLERVARQITFTIVTRTVTDTVVIKG